MALRIAVIAESSWHRVPGGTARATARTLEHLDRRPDLELIGVAARHRQPAAVALPIPVRHHWLHRPALYEGWLRVGRFGIDQLAGPVNALWAPAMVSPASSHPVVVTIHDLDFLRRPDRLSVRGRRFFPLAWRRALERARLLVCPSATVAEDCVDAGADSSRLRVVPWGVEPTRSTPDHDASVARALALPERFALWVGTVEPRKNLGRLVEAMLDVPDLPLVVVGPSGWLAGGDDVLRPLGDRAIRLGEVDDACLRSLYSQAEVFVFPSLAEGFGLPVLEAMAQSTPVVTSMGTATAEVAGDAAMLVDPTDPAAIACAVRELGADERLRAELARRGRVRIGEYTWERAAAGYHAAFVEVAGP